TSRRRRAPGWPHAPLAGPGVVPNWPADAVFLPSLYLLAEYVSSRNLRDAHTQQQVHDNMLRCEGILPLLSRCKCAQIKAIKQFFHPTYRSDAGLSGPNRILTERELIEQQGALPVNLAQSGEKFERLEKMDRTNGHIVIPIAPVVVQFNADQFASP